jgi:hypothetical protein
MTRNSAQYTMLLMHARQNITLTTVVLITLLIGAGARAQTVFKCTVEGKTTYQSQACTTGGKALQVDPGPSAAEIQEAQQRATREKNDASAAGAAAVRRETSPTPGPTSSLRNGSSGNCATLNQQHADAWVGETPSSAPSL